MVISDQLSSCLNWLTMQLTTKAGQGMQVKTNVSFSILYFPLPGTFFFYSSFRIQFKSTYSKKPFRILHMELISLCPTVFNKKVYFNNYILILELLYLCLGLGDSQVPGGQGSFFDNFWKNFGAMLSKDVMLHVCLFDLVERIT